MKRTPEQIERMVATRMGITIDALRVHRAAGEKRCSLCWVWKPLDEFRRNKHCTDGHHSTCRECHREYMRVYLHDRRECSKKQGAHYARARGLG